MSGSLLVALICHLLWLDDPSLELTRQIFDEMFCVGDEIGQLTEGYLLMVKLLSVEDGRPPAHKSISTSLLPLAFLPISPSSVAMSSQPIVASSSHLNILIKD